MTHPPAPCLVSSTSRLGVALSAAFIAFAVGCARPRSDSSRRPVPAGAFALVGDQALGENLLLRAAERGGLLPASEKLVQDALLARESAAKKPERAAVIERGMLVRGLLDGLRRQTLGRSQPRQEELDAAAQALWMQLDRPRCVRTVSLLAEVPPFGDGQREERVLRRVVQEVQGAGTMEEFVRRATSVEGEGASLQVVQVPPLTADGRVCAETSADAERAAPPVEYARAASELTHIGQTSELIMTSAGFHVLMATDILAPVVTAPDERDRRLREAVADRRIQADLDKLRKELTTHASVWRSPHRSTLTSLVWRTRPGQ
jgi:hypothetical protein